MKIKYFVFFLLINIFVLGCGNYVENLQDIIEYKYEFSNLTDDKLYSIFESFDYKPVGSMPSWNKRIGNILCSVGGSISERKINIMISDYKKYRNHEGYEAPDNSIKFILVKQLIDTYGDFSISDYTTYRLFPTPEIPLDFITLNVPTWRLDNRIIYLLDFMSDGRRVIFLTVRMI